ncbi:reverse transcriptase domain-containing protein [Tanacetum coccineum]
MAPKRKSTSTAPAMTQDAIKKLVTDSVAAALEAQDATMANADNTNRNTRESETPVARKCSYKPLYFKGTEGVVGLIRWFERTKSVFPHSNCTEDSKVKFATGTMTEDALSWWNSFAQPIRIEEAYKTTWSELKKLLTKKYCPRTEVKKMEDEFYSLTVKGNDLKTYIRRFQELAVLCPTMVPNTEKLMEVFIGGLPQSIEGNVTASKPQTLEEATTIAQRLMDQTIGILEIVPSVKDTLCITWDLALLNVRLVTREKGHCKNQCPKANNSARGKAYVMGNKNAHQNPNVVTSTFLLNQHLVRVLFDSGADKSFVSIPLASMLNIPPITLDTTYYIEMADGNLVGPNTVIQGCTLILLNQPFEIDLMPIKLDSFDVVVGMDWLSKYHAKIICDEKVVHILIGGETLIIRDLPGLPLIRQVEFQIDLIPRAAPVARAPYRLAPSEMQELSDQLQELANRGFIRPSTSPWGAPVLFFLGQVIDSQGIHVDPAKIEAVKDWASHTTPTKIRQFLGLAGYYWRFIEGFSKIAKSLTELTQKNKKYSWGKDQESAFQLLKQKLCEAPILALPEGNKDFVVYYDASL